MPKSVLTRGRSWIARISVLAVLTSMLAFGAAPAGAAIDTSSSCPDSIPSAGFTDLGGLDATTVQAIDCLVHYGISQGTSATTFSPNAATTRWQMALFLIRQAEIHGVTLPSGADQGFTDIVTLDATTQTAINQLAQLGITTGTSATTFSPFAVVPRWQMALFITRLLSAAGMTLPSGAPQGFTDLGGLSSAAITAINQLKQLGVADGTSATTFSPNAPVTRWQMALFLTRTLAADGVVPTGLEQVTVTPTTEASLGNLQARAYTATFVNSDGSTYTGKIGIQLVEVDNDGTPSYNNPANNAVIESVDGVAAGGATFNGFPGTDGQVTFIVRHTAGASEKTIPVVWIDADGDNGYDSTGDNPPTEPFGLGGMVSFTVPVAEASTGNYTGFTVTAVESSSFQASNAGVNCGNGVGNPCTFNFDDSDIYLIGGNLTSQATFTAALTVGDVVDITNYDSAQPSGSVNVTFNLVTDTTPAQNLVITDPSQAVEIDANNYVIKGTGNPGWLIAVYVDSTNDGVKTAGEPKVAGDVTVSGNGSWSVSVPLTQNATNDFVVTMRSSAGANDTGASDADHQVAQVPLITEGPPSAATLASTAATNGGTAGTLDIGDTIVITFSEPVAGVSNGDTIGIVDVDGSVATLTLGPDVTWTLGGGNTQLTLTIQTIVFASGGNTAGIQQPAQVTSISGFQGADGLAINVAGSGSGRVFGDNSPVGDAF